MSDTFSNMFQWMIVNGLRICVIIVIAYILIRLVRVLSDKMPVKLSEKEVLTEERRKRVDTLASIIQHTMTIVIMVLAGIVIMGQVGINVGPILAGAGILGLAVGFGAQNLVKDIITGFFILLENRMNVGDVIQAAGVAGLVQSINLRTTILRDLEGKVHIIPNGEILKKVGDELLEEPEYREVIIDPLEILGVDAFADSQVTIKVMFKTKPIKQWMVAREFRRRVKKAFDAEGIEIPFPHMTIYMGEAENKGKLMVQQMGTGL